MHIEYFAKPNEAENCFNEAINALDLFVSFSVVNDRLLSIQLGIYHLFINDIFYSYSIVHNFRFYGQVLKYIRRTVNR